MGITVSRMEAEPPASYSAPAAQGAPQLSAAVNVRHQCPCLPASSPDVLNSAVLYAPPAPRTAERGRVGSAQPSAARHSTLEPPDRCEHVRPSATVIKHHGLRSQAVRPKARTEEIIDYKKLPAPVKYEELQRESLMILKPETFEGLRFDFTRPLNQNFAVCHSLFAGNLEVPTNNAQVIKMPLGTYEFGANLVSNQGNMMVGRIQTDGRMTGRIKYDWSEWLSTKLQLQMASEAGMSQSMCDLEVKGGDYNAQLKFGSNQFYGFNYLQSVTPRLALGGEAFWLGQQRKSGTGFAGRYQSADYVATAQLASTGLVSLTFTQRISEKVSLASDLMWNWKAKEATASFGYDYMLRQCRLRGRIDSEGKVAALLEERLNQGVNFLLSGEIDHWKKDYKFGFGLTVGE